MREKPGIDRHGLVKRNAGNNDQDWRSPSMTKFLVAEDGSTSRSRGIEIIVPDAWEPPDAGAAPRADCDDSDIPIRARDDGEEEE